MKVDFTPHFIKDISKLRDQKLRDTIAEIIRAAEAAGSLSEIQNLKKLKGAANAYRIKTGSYRLGLFEEEEGLLFVRLLHRKDIYRNFP